jgi:hypothetical protein
MEAGPFPPPAREADDAAARWEGFHHAWAANIAQQLNRGMLPADYFV